MLFKFTFKGAIMKPLLAYLLVAVSLIFATSAVAEVWKTPEAQRAFGKQGDTSVENVDGDSKKESKKKSSARAKNNKKVAGKKKGCVDSKFLLDYRDPNIFAYIDCDGNIKITNNLVPYVVAEMVYEYQSKKPQPVATQKSSGNMTELGVVNARLTQFEQHSKSSMAKPQ
jgi:hypothetical protein